MSGFIPEGPAHKNGQTGYPRIGSKNFYCRSHSQQKKNGAALRGTAVRVIPQPHSRPRRTHYFGGRVLAASAFGSTIDEARSRAYRALDGISFERMFFRRDIGLPGAAVSPETEKTP
ncbi:hypothetical protein K7I13_06635 [Brucepastera parasyntrophica]|nr:hypothetical protein K7I13_06635 [Brucepastera parasyntrophica]